MVNGFHYKNVVTYTREITAAAVKRHISTRLQWQEYDASKWMRDGWQHVFLKNKKKKLSSDDDVDVDTCTRIYYVQI